MGRAVEGRRHLRLRPHEDPRRGLLDRHSPAHGVGIAARRARLLLHPHRPGRPLPADARQGGVLPDGLGRQRPADRAPGAELLRRPLRPLPAVRRRLHASRQAGREAPGADQPPELHRALRAAGGPGRADLRGPVAHARALGRLGPALHDHRTQGAEDQPARVPPQPRPRGGLPPGSADAVGRHVPDRRGAGRARGQGVRRALPPRALPRTERTGPHRDHPPRADPLGGGTDRPPRRRALPAAVRLHGDLTRVRGRDPRPGAPGGRARQGRRHRDVLHLR